MYVWRSKYRSALFVLQRQQIIMRVCVSFSKDTREESIAFHIDNVKGRFVAEWFIVKGVALVGGSELKVSFDAQSKGSSSSSKGNHFVGRVHVLNVPVGSGPFVDRGSLVVGAYLKQTGLGRSKKLGAGILVVVMVVPGRVGVPS